MTRDVKLEFFYAHPPERVWRALTEPALVKRWCMEPHGFEARVGTSFQFRAKPQGTWNGIVDCTVTECEAPRRLAYSWVGGHKQGHSIEYGRTTVRWTLTPENGGTRVQLEQLGFSGMKGFLLSFMLGQGWKGMLRKKLPVVLEDTPKLAA